MQELYKPCNNDVKIPYNTEFGIYTCTHETHAKKSKYASGFSLDKKKIEVIATSVTASAVEKSICARGI